MMNMNYHRMPGPHPGHFPANPFGSLAPRAAMNIANYRFAPTSFSGSDRAFYQNGYESGNDNRRRNAHRLHSERAEYKHMRHQPHMHAGLPHLGGYGLPGHRSSHLPSMFNSTHMHNSHLAHMRPRQQGFRLPMQRRPAPYGERMSARGAPYDFRQQINPYARRPLHSMFPRGYPPRSAARRPAYSASLFGGGDDDDDDDEFDLPSRNGYRQNWRDDFGELSGDDDDDDFSTSSMRGFSRYNRRSNRRFDTEWSDDEDEEDDNDDDDDWGSSRFGMESHRGPYRSRRNHCPNY